MSKPDNSESPTLCELELRDGRDERDERDERAAPARSHTLARYVAPPPAPAPVCLACKGWAPEVVVPIGDGAINLCWLCAHHHVDHGLPLSESAEGRCECMPWEIYPADVLAKRSEYTSNGYAQSVAAERSQHVEIDGRMVQYRFDRTYTSTVPVALPDLGKWFTHAAVRAAKLAGAPLSPEAQKRAQGIAISEGIRRARAARAKRGA